MELVWNKYTKRKVSIRALRFEPTIEFCDAICKASKDSSTPATKLTMGLYDHSLPPTPDNLYTLDTPRLFIETLEGSMEVMPGDYIVIGTNGEYYPCKPVPFEQVHSPAVDDWVFQELTKDTIVDIADWVHDCDSSTIHGVASAYIHKQYEIYGYLTVPVGSDGRVLHAMYGDYVARDPLGKFHVISAEVYRYMTA